MFRLKHSILNLFRQVLTRNSYLNQCLFVLFNFQILLSFIRHPSYITLQLHATLLTPLSLTNAFEFKTTHFLNQLQVVHLFLTLKENDRILPTRFQSVNYIT